MLEAIVEGYEEAFDRDFDEAEKPKKIPESVQIVMKRASKRTWKHLARERLDDIRPTIPLGKRFWPTTSEEADAIESMFDGDGFRRLATMVRSRADDVIDGDVADTDLCLMDIKEAIAAAAPADPQAQMPDDDGERVVEGARHISPFLGERMRSARLLDRSVFVRELMPQDLKIEIEHLTAKEATRAARYLATVVGFAHARQMDSATRVAWRDELQHDRTKTLDAPSWLWTSVVELLVSHEGAYLEHCRRFAGIGPIDAQG